MKILYMLLVVAINRVHAATIFDAAMEEWLLFKVQFNKQYTSTEEEYRRHLFIENKYKIANHNYNYEKGLVYYKMEINEFADLLHHEVIYSRNGFNMSLHTQSPSSFPKFVEPAYVELPESVDWRNRSAVTPVKDQGNCGSCWAFTATGALEGQLFRHTGELISLSEQNLIDCSSSFGNEGCTGGLMDNAFRYVKENGGIDSEEGYPYKEKNGTECSYKYEYRAGSNRGVVIIEKGDENKLQAAVATIGPIATAMDASHESFLYYSEGVYHEPNCSSTQLDHAVLVVGYGSENGNDYWLIKNSWGTNWGDHGYMKVMRNNGNHCGIATYASYPLV